MSRKHRCIMIGAGGMAGGWIRSFMPPFFDRMEVVALAEIRENVLNDQGDFLDLPASRRFTDMHKAFESVEADFAVVVIPPAVHREAAVGAAEAGLHVLSEKPIADSWEDCEAIYRAVQKAGVKMQITQNYRYTPRIMTLKHAVDSGAVGRPNYIMSRFSADYRRRGAWGAFRHEIAHTLLVEGSVHHFDQIRNIAGADCDTIAGWEWNPDHESFDGECCGTYVMRLNNGVYAHYEGNCLGGGEQNSWHAEYYRVEGDEGAAVVDRDGVVRVLKHTPGQGVAAEEAERVSPQWGGHHAIVHQFLEWLDGGAVPPSALSDNIKSAALLFGAIEASQTNQTVDVQAKLAALTG